MLFLNSNQLCKIVAQLLSLKRSQLNSSKSVSCMITHRLMGYTRKGKIGHRCS